VHRHYDRELSKFTAIESNDLQMNCSKWMLTRLSLSGKWPTGTAIRFLLWSWQTAGSPLRLSLFVRSATPQKQWRMSARACTPGRFATSTPLRARKRPTCAIKSTAVTSVSRAASKLLALSTLRQVDRWTQLCYTRRILDIMPPVVGCVVMLSCVSKQAVNHHDRWPLFHHNPCHPQGSENREVFLPIAPV
jgi:hypothetical protein